EAILSVNSHVYDEANRRTLQNLLVVIDFRTHNVTQLTDRAIGANISSTPWIGDMDGDGLLDVVYVHGTNPNKSYTFDGMRVTRVATGIPIRFPIRWGSYMGSRYDGIYSMAQPLAGKATP